MYDENKNNEEQTVGEQNNQNQENHEYRYGRSYYQNQQDSVYRMSDNANAYNSQSQNTASQNASQQNTGTSQSYGQQNQWNQSTAQGSQNTQQTQGYQQSTYQTYTTGQYGNPHHTQTAYTQQQTKKKKSSNKGWKKAVAVAACFVAVAAVGAGSAYGTTLLLDKNSEQTETTSARVTTKKTDSNSIPVTTTVSAGTAVVTDVSDVVEQTMPSVVKITNVGTTTYSNSFFGMGGTYEYESNGSGIIIGQTDDELLVVTNQHVVAGADTLKVIFIDEESCEANVKGTDSEKDLAVIAIPLESIKEDTLDQIKVATLGDSDNLKVGEPAIAIGNALGYGQSVTLGVISAKDREVTTENSTNKLIQTDAAINPGNSGGALLNLAGEVIGINSVKYSSTEVEGMGYAIPISDAQPIIDELMNKQTKTKVDEKDQAYMGISGVDITNDVSQAYNVPKGVCVAKVVEDSPAEKAGIKQGDIITKIEDTTITSFDELKAELEYYAAGTTIKVEVLSQAKGSYGYDTKTVEVTLAKKED